MERLGKSGEVRDTLNKPEVVIVWDFFPNKFFFMINDRIEASPFYNNIQANFSEFFKTSFQYESYCMSYST